MGKDSAIAWTHHTFNTWWGCTRVSPGCEQCYAETFAKRTGLGWGVQADRRFFGEKHWAEPLKWHTAAAKAGVRHRVFCASMADVFEDRPELEPWRLKLWALIEATPALDWLLLTKRPVNLRRMLPVAWLSEPRANVWLGTTVEDQRRADERVPHLLATPAEVRFLSCEPLLGKLSLAGSLGQYGRCPDCGDVDRVDEDGCCLACGADAVQHGIDWVIVGGESGGGARPMDLAWARAIVAQCRESKTACFVKQLGALPTMPEALWRESGRLITGRGADRVPDGHVALALADGKGGDMAEWPDDLRVRQFPITTETTNEHR